MPTSPGVRRPVSSVETFQAGRTPSGPTAVEPDGPALPVVGLPVVGLPGDPFGVEQPVVDVVESGGRHGLGARVRPSEPATARVGGQRVAVSWRRSQSLRFRP